MLCCVGEIGKSPHSKPHLIYNIPSKVIASKASGKVQAIASPNSSTTILCNNGARTTLPPFYVFKGKLRNDEL